VFLGAFFNLCLVFYEHRCFWRNCKAVRCDMNKLKVYNNRIVMLNQKRQFFSFEVDAKEYDPSSNSSHKLTHQLLNFVTDVSRELLLSIILIVASLYFRP